MVVQDLILAISDGLRWRPVAIRALAQKDTRSDAMLE